MNSAKGSALEWGLALLKAPAERHALRLTPLPPGIERLLAVAAGSEPEDSLLDAARDLGESPQRLREAAQFYAREVLFHPQADAYRTLGVEADAAHAQIKAHHRLLQLWLHPDRQQSEDDSVFAARVNIAWNRLRNDERRAAYDRDLAEARAALADDTGAEAEAMRRLVPAWLPAPPPERASNPWRHRAPVVALSAVCLMLGWLAVRNIERQPERWEWGAAEPEAPAGSAAAESTRAVATSSAGTGRDLPATAATRPTRSETPAVVERPMRALAAMVGLSDPAPELPPGPEPEPVDDVAQAPSRETIVMASPPPPPLPPPAPAAPPQLAMAARPLVPTSTVTTRVERERPGRMQIAIAPEPAPPPKPAPRPMVKPAVIATSEARTPAPARVVAAPVPATTRVSEPDIARIEQARRVGNQLLQYLATVKRSPPPIWNSPAIMSSADGVRQDLHSQGRARIGAPQWRIGNEAAVLASDYRVDGVEGPQGRGVLTANMVWRENRWLVVGLGMEQGR